MNVYRIFHTSFVCMILCVFMVQQLVGQWGQQPQQQQWRQQQQYGAAQQQYGTQQQAAPASAGKFIKVISEGGQTYGIQQD